MTASTAIAARDIPAPLFTSQPDSQDSFLAQFSCGQSAAYAQEATPGVRAKGRGGKKAPYTLWAKDFANALMSYAFFRKTYLRRK